MRAKLTGDDDDERRLQGGRGGWGDGGVGFERMGDGAGQPTLTPSHAARQRKKEGQGNLAAASRARCPCHVMDRLGMMGEACVCGYVSPYAYIYIHDDICNIAHRQAVGCVSGAAAADGGKLSLRTYTSDNNTYTHPLLRPCTRSRAHTHTYTGVNDRGKQTYVSNHLSLANEEMSGSSGLHMQHSTCMQVDAISKSYIIYKQVYLLGILQGGEARSRCSD